MYLSVVIPAFNEEKRIGATLKRIFVFLEAQAFEYEVILVDDGSVDATVATALESDLAKRQKLRVFKNEENEGKGFSVKKGLLSSRGEYVLFTDADLSAPIEELGKLFESLKKGNDVALGSRSISSSRIRIRQPWYRESMGKVFNWLVRIFLISDFKDTQCGFKLLKGPVARDIASMLKIDGFCFDVELLYLAKKKDYLVQEVGIVWENSAQSKVQVLGSSLHMFLDLFRIKRLHSCDR